MKNKCLLLILLLACLCGCASTQKETAHVHDFVQQVVEPTCLKKGYTQFTCACGDSYKDHVTPARGHVYAETVTAPTWEDSGYTDYLCDCGNSYRGNFVECEKYSTLPLSESKQVLHFFDDAAFIGDSVMCKLQAYHMYNGTFGKAKFFARVGYATRHAAKDTFFLLYRGKQSTPEKILEACGAKKLFIMLGMNDINSLSIEKTLEYWDTMLGRIRKKCPDIEIFIMSCTPVYIPSETHKLNNKKMDSYNVSLEAFAKEKGCHFIDVATPMKDEKGGLKKSFCQDNWVHVNQAGCEVWAQTLKKYIMELENTAAP